MARLALIISSAATLLALAGTAGAAPSEKPAIRIVHGSPLTVRGAHFPAGHAVTVTAAAGGAEARAQHAARSVRASAEGAFTVSFPTLRRERCAILTIRARSDNGAVAAIKIAPECPPLQPIER